jgi:hypothetical protein
MTAHSLQTLPESQYYDLGPISKILLSQGLIPKGHWDEWQRRCSRSCYRRFQYPAPEYKLLSNFHRINGRKLKNEWFCTIKYSSNCITPFLETQLVDVEILVIVLLRMGNFGLMAVSMIVWV